METGEFAAYEHRLSPKEVKRAIKGFDTDDDGDWRAMLECGHYQHVRHDPPLRVREWVLSGEGRESRIGQTLECKKCDDRLPPDFQNIYD